MVQSVMVDQRGDSREIEQRRLGAVPGGGKGSAAWIPTSTASGGRERLSSSVLSPSALDRPSSIQARLWCWRSSSRLSASSLWHTERCGFATSGDKCDAVPATGALSVSLRSRHVMRSGNSRRARCSLLKFRLFRDERLRPPDLPMPSHRKWNVGCDGTGTPPPPRRPQLLHDEIVASKDHGRVCPHVKARIDEPRSPGCSSDTTVAKLLSVSSHRLWRRWQDRWEPTL